MTKKFKELKQSTSVDEISLKSLSNTIAKSTSLKNTQKAMKKTKDDTKNDLAALRKRLDALKAGYAAESVELDEGVIDQVKDIVAKKQAKKISGVMVDMFTASAISQIYDKVNDANKAKLDKLPITKLADVAMKMMKRESVELDENKSLIKDYEKYMSQGNKKDHNAIDYLMSMPKYKRMSKDQMAKMIGDHKRKGIFKEEVEVEESLSAAIKKKMDKDAKKQADAMAKVKAKGGVIGRTGSGVKMKEEVELDEAPRRKGAPKMTGDSIAIQRAKDAEHAKAMGRSVKTGRKLPKKTMTSTQMSLASLRREEVELDEAKGMNMNLKLINKIKKSGVVKTGSMSKDGAKKEETNEVLDTPKAMQSYRDKAKYSADRAANSAAAKILRGKDKDGNRVDHSPEVKTRDKRAKGLKMVDRNAVRKTFNALRKKEDVNEAKKGGYDIYHKDFSGAMQHAYAAAKKNYGITIKPSEIDDKVASGPRKPSNGKTNTYRLEGDKGAIQVQVYNTGSKYELNMYKE